MHQGTTINYLGKPTKTISPGQKIFTERVPGRNIHFENFLRPRIINGCPLIAAQCACIYMYMWVSELHRSYVFIQLFSSVHLYWQITLNLLKLSSEVTDTFINSPSKEMQHHSGDPLIWYHKIGPIRKTGVVIGAYFSIQDFF